MFWSTLAGNRESIAALSGRCRSESETKTTDAIYETKNMAPRTDYQTNIQCDKKSLVQQNKTKGFATTTT